jgi:FtsH-binding integral membrane protein
MNNNLLNTQALFNFKELSPKATEHLSKVYGTLALTLTSCSVGVIIAPAWVMGSFLSMIAGLILTFYLVYQIHAA